MVRENAAHQRGGGVSACQALTLFVPATAKTRRARDTAYRGSPRVENWRAALTLITSWRW